MLIIVRIIVLFLLLSGTLVFGILPICIRPYLNSCKCFRVHHRRCATRNIRLATCFLIFFGGGVLLATCLVHLLHEARQGFEEALAKCYDVDTNATASVDTGSNDTFASLQSDFQNDTDDLTTFGSVEVTTTIEFTVNRNFTRPFQSVLEKEPVYDSVLCSADIARTLFPLPEFITVCGFFLIYFFEELVKFLIQRYKSCRHSTLQLSDVENADNNNSRRNSSEGHIRQLSELDDLSSVDDKSTKVAINNGLPNFKEECNNISLTVPETPTRKSINDLHFFFGHGSAVEDLNVEGLEDFMTLLALSFNSVFEGFAAGFQHTEISTWMLFVSLSLHKFVSAFVVSLETLHSGGSNLRVSLYMIIFSLMCPIGMMAAILTHRNLVESSSLQIGVLNALSVGTLLYVTFYEMLRQRKDFAEISGFAQFFVLLMGFIAMSTVEYFYTRVE